MTRYKFIAVWRVEGKTVYCNIEHTRRELIGDVIRLWDGDMFVGQFDLGFVDVAYFTEARE